MFTDASLLILAGGESKRMGTPKHLMTVHGENIIDFVVNRLGKMFDEVIVAGRGIQLTRTDVRVLDDVLRERTPLAGLLTATLASGNSNVFAMGCDMPFVRPSLIKCLLSQKTTADDIVVPFVGGYYEPLCAVYSCSISSSLREYIENGGRKITDYYQLVNVKRVMDREIEKIDPQFESFINLNTPSDFERYNSSILTTVK